MAGGAGWEADGWAVTRGVGGSGGVSSRGGWIGVFTGSVPGVDKGTSGDIERGDCVCGGMSGEGVGFASEAVPLPSRPSSGVVSRETAGVG